MNQRPGTDDCARLLRAAFPALVLESLSELGEGWDSIAFLVNDDLVFRLPKRDAVERMLERERTLLALIAERLPVPVPRCTLVARNLPGFPSALGGYPLIKGISLDRLSTWNARHNQLTRDIAQFLRALHGIDLRFIPIDLLGPVAPDDWWRARWQLYLDVAPSIEQSCSPSIANAVRDRWEQAFAESRAISFSPVLIHGDLAADHILVNNSEGLAGVIDFSDAGPGDPALDLAGLPESLAAEVIAHYADNPEQRVGLDVRRRFYRLSVPFHAIRAGQEWLRPDLIAAGLAGVRDRFSVPSRQ